MFGLRKRVYLDYASATPMLAESVAAAGDASRLFANPGGIHAESVAARALLERARERIAAHCAVKAREIIFTSGLTESNNLAILGYARAQERVRRSLDGTHWIVSAIEHASVLECFAEVERMGGAVSYVMPDARGVITPESVAALLRAETIFVSIGWANSELGVVQPLSAIARILKERERTDNTQITLHTDAGQAPLYLSPQPHTLGVDLMTVGSGKLYGPRGFGFCFVRARTTLAPVLFGGSQERGLRAGTEDVALAIGCAAALDVIAKERSSESERLCALRDMLAKEIRAAVPDAVVNGDVAYTLPHMLNISIPRINAEYLVLLLDRAGFALSTKSACREGEADSHVVLALGGDAWRARTTVRISLGRSTTAKDLTRMMRALIASIPKARHMVAGNPS